MNHIIDARRRIGLPDIQGNILKGHGRKYSALVAFCFGPDAAQGRRLLRDAADPGNDHAITTAAAQQQDADVRRAWSKTHRQATEADTPLVEWSRHMHRPFRSLNLTAEGLTACGFTRDGLKTTATAWDHFWQGMNRTPETDLEDPEKWEDKYRQPVHGAWLLANAGGPALQTMVRDCGSWLGRYGATVQYVEQGFRWEPYEDGIAHEPFGFADGFARTRVTVDHGSSLWGLIRRGIDAVISWFTRASELPLRQVIVTEPAALAGSSFLVWRKLDQNVSEFVRAEQELQGKLDSLKENAPPVRPRDAGALFIGRERDGTPLVWGGFVRKTRFSFNQDQEAGRCPFHAHIRKINPRQDFGDSGNGEATVANQRATQFIRRGVVYSEGPRLKPRWDKPEEAPAGGVGLQFLAYMSNIGSQFARMHVLWAPVPNFPTGDPAEGIDPLAEKKPAAGWEWRAYPGLTINFQQRLVTPKAGAYFLVPAIGWLKRVP